MRDAQAVEKRSSVLAIVAGEPLTEVPDDLFIPPDALEVLLDSFSGPLDLLLYLIRKQNIDILDIPMTRITQQYMQYIEMMKVRELELAADYLVMAALLMEIKSKMLLPARESEASQEDEEDPRMALVRRLQIYEQFKEVAEWMEQIPRCERDFYPVDLTKENIAITQVEPDVLLGDLVQALENIIKQQGHRVSHQITKEPLSVRERMSMILERLGQEHFMAFSSLFTKEEGRMGVVVSFLAILELARQSLLSITQVDGFSPIHIKVKEDG